jgi:hypothetical protein
MTSEFNLKVLSHMSIILMFAFITLKMTSMIYTCFIVNFFPRLTPIVFMTCIDKTIRSIQKLILHIHCFDMIS